MWSMLMLTLPTQPNAVRLRIWRALKALGCAALRDGAYLLPAAQGDGFEPLAAEVREHGGTALVLELSPRDDAQRDQLLALFDRGEAYARWHASATALQAAALVGGLLVWITPFRIGQAMLMGLVAGACGTLGEFVMKALKKDAGVRYWGNQSSVTGAVGLLDRVAPLCFAAPVFFHAVRWYFKV